MSQRKFELSETSVKIFAAVGQDTAWNRSVSDRQQWVSGNQEIQHDWGNIGLVRRSDGENAEKNTPATGIADLCHLQNPEEDFDVLFYIFFSHSANFSRACFTCRLFARSLWLTCGMDHYLSVSCSLWSPLFQRQWPGNVADRKPCFHLSLMKKETLRFHYELQLVCVLPYLVLLWRCIGPS